MGKPKGRTRIERRLTNMSTPATEPAPWMPPDVSECTEEPIEFDLDATNRAIMRLRYQHGQMVDFALMHQTRIGAAWFDVSRVDCCHGEAHQHIFNVEGDEIDRRVLRTITKRTDVPDAYDEAYSAVMDEYEEHLRRWQSVKP